MSASRSARRRGSSWKLALVAVLLLAPSACGPTSILRERLPRPAATAGGKGITFYYDDPGALNVWLAGGFNNWAASFGNRFLIDMKKNEQGVWTVTLPFRENVRDPEFDALTDDVYVEHGRRYSYKVVVNSSSWVPDPSNPSTEPDGFGGQNSVIVAP